MFSEQKMESYIKKYIKSNLKAPTGYCFSVTASKVYTKMSLSPMNLLK